MTCRHAPGDPDCSSSPAGRERAAREQAEYSRQQTEKSKKALEARIAELEREIGATTPDKMRYEIVEVVEVGPHLVLRAKYPNCSKCSYEGTKVMVFLNTSLRDVVFWKSIDPHFFEEKRGRPKTEAPSPWVRFHATKEGWDDALAFARYKAAKT